MVKTRIGSHFGDSVYYADNAKILRSRHKKTWDTLHRYFTELLLKTMYVPLSNTPELDESRPAHRNRRVRGRLRTSSERQMVDSGPQSLVTFNVRSNGWIWWDAALNHRVINDAVGYVPPLQNYPDSNVFVPMPESWAKETTGHPRAQTIKIFPHTGGEIVAVELLSLWNLYRPYDHFFPPNQHELIAPEIYYYLTKAIRSQRDEDRQGASAGELAIGLTSNIAGSRSIEDSQKMARTIQIYTEKQMLHIPALINRRVWV